MHLPVINHQYSYNEYHNYVTACAENNSTSGNEKLPERIDATKLNVVRMNRLDKQIEIKSELKDALNKLQKKLTWILIAETWCGDGAQNIPIIAKIASLNPLIDLKIILRDENPEIMDRYLTNGSRAIPKLICYETLTGKELGIWGARPARIQAMVKEYKAANPNVLHDEFVKNVHLWYAKDKGESVQLDFIELIKNWL